MAFAERFEDLNVWQDARELCINIYRGFSPVRDFNFRNQIQSAALSVMNNIAEGFERRTKKDFAHFLDIAKGSAGEVRSMLYVAGDLGYLRSDEITPLQNRYETISRSIGALASRLRNQ